MIMTPLYTWSKTAEDSDGIPLSGLSICDAYAMAVALDPTIGKQPHLKRVCVELGGHYSRGQLVTDHYYLTDHFFEITCYHGFDIEKFIEMLKKSVKNL